MTDLSIITVSYKGWDRLTKLLQVLNGFSGTNIKTEVIVVDNKSDDNTIFTLESRFPGIRFIHNKINGGFANGCNLGAKNARGEFLLFLNPDTIASEPELEKLLAIAKLNPDFSLLSCRQVNENGKESISSGPFPEFWNLTGFQRALSGWINSSHLSASWRTRTSHLTPNITFPHWIYAEGSAQTVELLLFAGILQSNITTEAVQG
jgi:GT2 family glycosyltransferase